MYMMKVYFTKISLIITYTFFIRIKVKDLKDYFFYFEAKGLILGKELICTPIKTNTLRVIENLNDKESNFSYCSS